MSRARYPYADTVQPTSKIAASQNPPLWEEFTQLQERSSSGDNNMSARRNSQGRFTAMRDSQEAITPSGNRRQALNQSPRPAASSQRQRRIAAIKNVPYMLQGAEGNLH
ncbi:hypothetical protein M431DRAFT_537353 [Trichoderma harzianum CBS 226.95]|uniref:Uncharacterized protein n=1 Tax=Trichoderma harzianum CBS 226.95 TaxID=983964 RepID=A0A2T4ATV3_TRIHA|nr:hypothetical protein M431DRAFT_537353 [Trichoderma harzianum CBS 226.95]PTB60495.1 hypothetical protein M431DRAFT_537353 [Trichoderma harzianum CBS 226.95]